MLESSPSEYDENFGIPEQADSAGGEGTGPEFSFAPEGGNDNGAETETPEALRGLGAGGDNPMAASAIEPNTENFSSSREDTKEPRPTWATTTITNPDNGNSCEIWLPPDNANMATALDSDGTIKLTVGGEPRELLESVIAMANTFSQNNIEHIALGHDCGVFAVACLNKEVPTEVLFAVKGRDSIAQNVDTAEVVTDETDISPGEVVVLCHDKPDGTVRLPVHYMVKANTDQGVPLYASKLGLLGPVVLSTLKEIQKFYPTSGQTRKLREY